MSLFINGRTNESQKLGVGVGKCRGKGKVRKNITNFCLNLAKSGPLKWIAGQIISTLFDSSHFLTCLFFLLMIMTTVQKQKNRYQTR